MKYNNLLNRNGLEVNKVTIKKNASIINTPLGRFVIKKNNGIRIYDYLLSRGFDYFPKIIDYDDEFILFEYINDISYDLDEKALDFIKLLAFLHSKTSYFKDIDIDEYKAIYENTMAKIIDLKNYYNNLINIIENKEYMSPSEYLIARNISIIFSSLNYCEGECKKFLDLVKDKNKKRVVTLYNNIDIDNLLKSKNNIYLTSFDKSIVDLPIYDLFNFYKKYSSKFDFVSLLKQYRKLNKLNEEELTLLFLLISLPDKIILNNNIDNIKNIKQSINKIYDTLKVLNSEEEEKRRAHEKKDN